MFTSLPPDHLHGLRHYLTVYPAAWLPHRLPLFMSGCHWLPLWSAKLIISHLTLLDYLTDRLPPQLAIPLSTLIVCCTDWLPLYLSYYLSASLAHQPDWLTLPDFTDCFTGYIISSLPSVSSPLPSSLSTPLIVLTAYLAALLRLFTSPTHCLLTASLPLSVSLLSTSLCLPSWTDSLHCLLSHYLADCFTDYHCCSHQLSSCLPHCLSPSCLLPAFLSTFMFTSLTSFFHLLPHWLRTNSVYLTGHTKKPLKSLALCALQLKSAPVCSGTSDFVRDRICRGTNFFNKAYTRMNPFSTFSLDY